jgi:hypothetical protein
VLSTHIQAFSIITPPNGHTISSCAHLIADLDVFACQDPQLTAYERQNHITIRNATYPQSHAPSVATAPSDSPRLTCDRSARQDVLSARTMVTQICAKARIDNQHLESSLFSHAVPLSYAYALSLTHSGHVTLHVI